MTAGSLRTPLVERAAPFLHGNAGLAPLSRPKPPLAEAGWIAAGWDPDQSVIAPALPAIESPCLAVEALQKAGLVVTGRERTRNSEEYRVSIDRILRGLRSTRSRPGPANLLMVTSARPGEGKSFTALNIAASIAINELAEVLLLDIDAKPLSTTAQLGLADTPGLLNLAADPTLRVEDALIRTAIGGLSYLPIGTRDLAATEPGVTRSVSATLERIRRRFARHLVLLDCAPCLSTSDPSTLASLVDQVVLVVEAERTQRNEVESSLELIKACPNITLLLNKVRLTSSSTFGAYYHGGPASSASER